jgi:metal-sulfur cluster biosynthetic enzyme
MKSAFDEEVGKALEQVCDPCSIASNAPISIIDMGLVKGWTLGDAGDLVVRMCVTSACCTMAPNIVKGAEEVILRTVTGVRSVRVEIDPTIFWTPDSMTERGRQILAARRQASLAASKVAPQQWRNQIRGKAAGAPAAVA